MGGCPSRRLMPAGREAPGADDRSLSPLEVDGSRPAAAWVSSLPASWTTTAERLVLYVLALDAFDRVSAPTWAHLRQWTGMWQDAVSRAIQSLEVATAVRPALIERLERGGQPLAPGQRNRGRNRTRYRLRVEVDPREPDGDSRSVVDESEPDGDSRSVRDTQLNGATGRSNRTEQPDGDSRSTPCPTLPPNSSPQVPTDPAIASLRVVGFPG